MRNIFSFLTSALVLLAVTVACHPSEITNPDNPDPKGKSEITITASIIQTRVSYDCSGLGEVTQEWVEGDVVFGYYHKKDDEPSTSKSNQIIFSVSKVDPGTGIATLKVESPSGWIDTADDGTVVDLVYTGDDDIANLPFSGSGIDVDLSGQSLDRVPGCMHAHAELQVKDNKKSLEFKFQNDCALIEIEGLTGVMEEWNDYLPATQTSTGISYISIPNLYLNGSYSFISRELSFVTTDTKRSYEITLDPNNWLIDNQGFINGPTDSQGNPQRILIAVAPFLDELPFKVNSTIEDFGEFPDRTIEYDYKKLEQGHCYVITSQPVVAKTADGQYFRSVKAAFDHAEYLYDNDIYTTVETNYVKLLRPYINGLVEDVAHEEGNYLATIINIDYPVTLDLNGCLLSLDCCEDENDDLYQCEYDSFYSGGFEVEFGGTLTIDDSGDSGCIDSGSKKNDTGFPIITNSGTVNILGGSLSHWESGQVINSTGGTVNVSGGELYAYDSPSLTLSGSTTIGYITSGAIGNNSQFDENIQILDGADCTISGGVIYSKKDMPTITCRSTGTNEAASTLTVMWPNGEAPDSPSAGTGPIIYAKGAEHYITAPISVESSASKNTAVVKIQGGYLITSNVEHAVVFYTNNETSTTANNLDLRTFGNFYSNATKIHKDGDTWHTKEEELADNYYELLSEKGYSLGTGFNSKADYVGNGFSIPYLGDATGDLYEITTTGTQSL